MSRRRRDERGAFVVLWALMCAAMLTMVAIVIDLGDLRDGRRQMQTVADLSALAAGDTFSTAAGRNPMSACKDAIRYINQNLEGLPSPIDPDNFCRQQGKEIDKTICSIAPPDGRLQATPSTDTGPYHIEIHYPVPDAEIADPATPTGRSRDGDPCERLRVVINRTKSSLFAGVIGVHELTIGASATMRRLPPSASEIPALWLLDPHGCTSLTVSGTGTVVKVGTSTTKGLVTVDSDGTQCTGNSSTLDANGGATLTALPSTGPQPGQISLNAMPADATACRRSVVHDCDEADVPSNVSPQPIRRDRRATRGPVDWKYNCKRNYPLYLGEVTVDDCQVWATTPPYIDQLRAAVGASGSVPNFTDYNGPCTINGAAKVFAAGNWRINCPSGFDVKTNVTFDGGNVVFDGPVSVGTGATLLYNYNPASTNLSPSCLDVLCVPLKSSAGAAIFYIRNGGLTVNSGGNLNLKNTFVYEDGGDFRFSGGGTPIWSAPIEGPFKALAYWNEFDSQSFSLSGGAAMSLSGVFFTPNARPFTIAGGSPAAQQNAQFVSRQLVITGGGTLNLSPQGVQAIPLPPPVAFLIR